METPDFARRNLGATSWRKFLGTISSYLVFFNKVYTHHLRAEYIDISALPSRDHPTTADSRDEIRVSSTATTCIIVAVADLWTLHHFNTLHLTPHTSIHLQHWQHADITYMYTFFRGSREGARYRPGRRGSTARRRWGVACRGARVPAPRVGSTTPFLWR